MSHRQAHADWISRPYHTALHRRHTGWVSESMDRTLPVLTRIKLRLHLMICEGCCAVPAATPKYSSGPSASNVTFPGSETRRAAALSRCPSPSQRSVRTLFFKRRNIPMSSCRPPYNHEISRRSTGRSGLLNLLHACEDVTQTTHTTPAVL